LLFQCVFFFFQAEDGIRDWSVTGVQTCALPIYVFRVRGRARDESRGHSLKIQLARGEGGVPELLPVLVEHQLGISRRDHPVAPRSEERRVGKECRSRWWADL